MKQPTIMKILFVYKELSTQMGGGVFTQVILKALRTLDCELMELPFTDYKNSIEKIRNQLKGHVKGMTPEVESQICAAIQNNAIDTIIFNSSNYGNVIAKIKKKYPKIKTICIFHNVEYDFVLNAAKVRKSPFSLMTLLVVWQNEKNTMRFANTILTLNKRDSESLFVRYKRRADGILPLCLEDRFDSDKLKEPSGSKVGAFIGSNFYANNKGIKWFCEYVSNKIDCKILVIGKGFESEKEYFSNYPNIQLIGSVPAVDDYYYDVDFIVSPIFDGSGMKTKTAEALMFGKTIFGTKEAFEGYSLDYDKVGALCNDASAYVEKINDCDMSKTRYNDYSRNVFLENYSINTLINKFKEILMV